MSARSCKYQSFLASQKSESPRSRPKGSRKPAACRLSWGVSFVFVADPLPSYGENSGYGIRQRTRRRLVLSHPPSPRLRGPRWQAHRVGEDVLIMGDAIQRERVEVARIRPDGMRLRSYLQDQSAVVAVEPGLDAVRRQEDGRDHLEVERCVRTGSARQNIVGVFGSHAVLTGWRRCDGIRIPFGRF